MRVDLPVEVAGLLRPDGSVVVPPELAADVLRRLLRDLVGEVRANGCELSTAVRGLLWALHRAQDGGVRSTQTPAPDDEKGTQIVGTPGADDEKGYSLVSTPGGDQAFSRGREEGWPVVPTLGGSVPGTPVAGAASVEVSTAEAARRMGCSESYVRRLARLGLVPARRVAGVWLITRAAGAAEDDVDTEAA
ncbi:helix-turn-helix domain-containing protein [Streptomyces olivaceus]|uniref:helix-turn-helix domain-containing protein n=1 Tax=Streptomyces olivaceus TaxID=47716 RepID=UPI00381B0E76